MQAQTFFYKHFILFLSFNIGIAQSMLAQSMPVLPESQLELSSSKTSLRFKWLGDSVYGKWEQHTALLIPVKITGCPRQLYMQFDLGVPNSIFYGNKLAAIRSKYPKAIPQDLSAGKLQHFSFKAGKIKIYAREIGVKQFDSSSINWQQPGIEIIGTLGADLIDGRTIAIDYPRQKLMFDPQLPSSLKKKATFKDFMYAGRSVLLPATVQDKNVLLYFDTGSSMYELLISKAQSEAMAIPGSQKLVSQVNSWGKILTATSLPTSDSVLVNDQNIPLRYTTYIDGINETKSAQMLRMGIGGMTGNKLFLDYVLVLDTKHKKFALLRKN